MYIDIYRAGSCTYICTSEFDLIVNCRRKENFGVKFGLAWPTVGQANPDFILQFTFSCNLLKYTYMIQLNICSGFTS